MEDLKKKLENLKNESYALMSEMEKAVFEFVKQNGGLIETEKEDCDAIYGVIYNEGSEMYEEHKILKVKTGYGTILVYAEIYPNEEENWFAPDMTWRNATLHNLCECLPEYV